MHIAKIGSLPRIRVVEMLVKHDACTLENKYMRSFYCLCVIKAGAFRSTCVWEGHIFS
jgi:hypothetical protein